MCRSDSTPRHPKGRGIASVEVRLKGISAKTIFADVEGRGVIAESYLLEHTGSTVSNIPFAPISGMPAHVAKKLGRVQTGLFGEDQ
jgi:hypothetical protein